MTWQVRFPVGCGLHLGQRSLLLETNMSNLGIASWSFLPRLLEESDLTVFAADWVMLSDVLAFDVRVYDPEAPLFARRPMSIRPWHWHPVITVIPAVFQTYIGIPPTGS